jgi:hypothetical protein
MESKVVLLLFHEFLPSSAIRRCYSEDIDIVTFFV